MSVDNIALDLSRLSFDTTPDLLSSSNTPLLASRPKSRTNNAPSITITQEKKTPRSRDRNRQCVPSDDEEDDDEEDVDSSDEEDIYQKKKNVAKRKTKKPLPSDDEDEDEDEDDDSDAEQRPSPMYRRLSGVGSTSNLHGRSPTPQQRPNAEMAKRYSDGGNHQYDSEYRHSTDEYFVEGSHLHHLQQMQHHHHTQIAQFQHQHPSFLRPQQQQQQQRVSMSGMDLLKQLEQEKAEAKRQKPKLNTSNVKIEKGLLANLPEPGSHNISFQQMAMQQQQHHHHHHHHQGKPRHQRSASSLENNKQQHRQQQPQHQHQQYGYYPAHAVPAAPVGYMYPQQQQLVYPYLNAANGGGLVTSQSFNASSPSLVMLDTHQPSRPGSALSNSSRRRSGD